MKERKKNDLLFAVDCFLRQRSRSQLAIAFLFFHSPLCVSSRFRVTRGDSLSRTGLREEEEEEVALYSCNNTKRDGGIYILSLPFPLSPFLTDSRQQLKERNKKYNLDYIRFEDFLFTLSLDSNNDDFFRAVVFIIILKETRRPLSPRTGIVVCHHYDTTHFRIVVCGW